MKAITIRQPWAHLIATGDKLYETRSWKTEYRGPIAIHAAKMVDQSVCYIMSPLATLDWLTECGITSKVLREDLPRGAVIATAELVRIWRIVYHPGLNVDRAKNIQLGAESLTLDRHAPDFGDYFVPTEKETAFGNWKPGHYAWELQNVKVLPEPIPAMGKQGLWDWEPERR